VKSKTLIITVAIALATAGAGFFGGMKYQQSRITSGFRQFANGNRANPNGVGGTNTPSFRPVSGEIISADDGSITVKLNDGSSKLVLLTDTTAIAKSSEAQKQDLNTGEQVLVTGTQNSDGSVTAQNIQINPQNSGFIREQQQN